MLSSESSSRPTKSSPSLRYLGTDAQRIVNSEGLQFDSNAVEEKEEFLTCAMAGAVPPTRHLSAAGRNKEPLIHILLRHTG